MVFCGVLCCLIWPHRRQASSHRYRAWRKGDAVPVGAGLPAIGPVQAGTSREGYAAFRRCVSWGACAPARPR
ncbi:hypothetical protein C6A77_23965 [Pseudomonas sp. AFG_SD02_1510_Pfu_092]|nr:hypothetical protein C6A77_23965 [Pseudomonas sp. AFG_SD02_1510_Pfu_092]